MTAPEPTPWQGRVFRHIPSESPFAPLDPRFAARSRDNRWNLPGEPTLIFGSNRDLLDREFAAHFSRDRAPELIALVRPRQVFECAVRLNRLFDLTDPAILAALGIAQAPECFGDRATARATAGFLRHVRAADGLLVPSMVARDDRSQWNLVVFLDRLDVPIEQAIEVVQAAGTFGTEVQSVAAGKTGGSDAST